MAVKFSIIIPTYNSSKFIRNGLDSIARQTYQNVEVIIIDGLSSDNSLEIIKTYDGKIPNLKVISEKDNGIYDAMNKGIKLASGEWLYFMGSDDAFFDKNVLSDISHQLQDNEVIYAKVVSKSLGGEYGSEFSNKKIYFRNIGHQGIFFKSSVFIKTGLFDIKYKVWADWDHNLKWFLNTDIKKKFVNIIIARYADGGFSSKNKDLVFESDKEQKYFQLTGKKIYFKFIHRLYYYLKDKLK